LAGTRAIGRDGACATDICNLDWHIGHGNDIRTDYRTIVVGRGCLIDRAFVTDAINGCIAAIQWTNVVGAIEGSVRAVNGRVSAIDDGRLVDGWQNIDTAVVVREIDG
jgi:hypothetical protein